MLLIGSLLDGFPSKALRYRLFTPLYGLMASRYRRGDAVTTALVGRDFHPHGYSVTRLFEFLPPLFLASYPQAFRLFQLNESHVWQRFV